MHNFNSDIKIHDEKKDNRSGIFPGGKTKKLYIESYGCQMNFSDSEIVSSIMNQEGFETIPTLDHADVILINTCSIR